MSEHIETTTTIKEDKHSSAVPKEQTDSLNASLLVWIFVLGSIAGLLMETVVSFFLDGKLEDRAGLLWGPFSPIYGFGAVLMSLVLYRLRNSSPFLVFLVAAFMGALFEYLVGWLLESAFGIVAWSYYNQPFNVGHTSLALAIIWGCIGLAWIKILYPRIARAVKSVPRSLRNVLTTLFLVFMILNGAMTVLSFNQWFHRQAGEPVETPMQIFFDEHFGDEFMAERFQTMSMWVELSDRSKQ